MQVTRFFGLVAVLAGLTGSFVADAQIVPFYPTEVTFGLLGYTNFLPGCDPSLYSTFSSTKVLYHKEFLSTDKLTNTVLWNGIYERYLDKTSAGSYHPFWLNAIARTYAFGTDILTLGLEVNANMETVPSVDLSSRIQSNFNRRIRITHFHYLLPHPRLVIQERLTYGMSRNSRASQYDGNMIREDYDIARYEARAMLLTGLHTRLYLTPFLFANEFRDLPARSRTGQFVPTNPKLREKGAGVAVGAKYYNYRWGSPEAALEYVRNWDRVFGANTYDKWKARVAWENQYFVKAFGYNIKAERSWVDSELPVTAQDEQTKAFGELYQIEYLFDMVLIVNVNQHVSVRPEYDVVYRYMAGDRTVQKTRYWLNIHFIL